MHWKRPHHVRWLAACVLAFLLTGYGGGFTVPVGTVFLIIFLVGAVLLSSDASECDVTGSVTGSDTGSDTGSVTESEAGAGPDDSPSPDDSIETGDEPNPGDVSRSPDARGSF